MRGARQTLLGLLGVTLLGAPPAPGASFDCNTRWLSQAELTICDDQHLSHLDDQVARRVDTLARRLNFGQYLGLRHWQAMVAQQRTQCAADRDCIASSFKSQARFLDQFQRCIAASLSRRGCLRDLVGGERESMRR